MAEFDVEVKAALSRACSSELSVWQQLSNPCSLPIHPSKALQELRDGFLKNLGPGLCCGGAFQSQKSLAEGTGELSAHPSFQTFTFWKSLETAKSMEAPIPVFKHVGVIGGICREIREQRPCLGSGGAPGWLRAVLPLSPGCDLSPGTLWWDIAMHGSPGQPWIPVQESPRNCNARNSLSSSAAFWNHGITEGWEENIKITESNHQPSPTTTVTTNPRPQVPHPRVF